MTIEEVIKENIDLSIDVRNVTKIYSLYKRPSDRLIDTFHLMPWKKYPKNLALNDVSFSVAKGETVGIIGTNGSGKSTVLKIITGVLTPTKGKATVNGRISALLELGAGFNAEYTGVGEKRLSTLPVDDLMEKRREKIKK